MMPRPGIHIHAASQLAISQAGSLPVLDTTQIHVDAAIERMLRE